jgi:hypothetical protein
VIAWMLFHNPMTLHFESLLWLLLPLCASVAVVYRTVRIDDLRRLPRSIVELILYMVGGLVALGAALWLVHEYWPF